MNVKISVIQLGNYIGNYEQNFQAAEQLIKGAAADGAALVALPELSSCGYIPNDEVWRYGEPATGITSKWACEIAKRYHVYVGAGFWNVMARIFSTPI